MKHIKIISTEQGDKRVKCFRIGEFRDAHECEKCKRFVQIDNVKAEIKCKERI